MMEHVIGGKFATGFTVGLLAKDVAIAEALGHAMEIEAPLVELVARRWADARDAVGPMRDNTEAYLAWNKSTPKIVKKRKPA
jgi:3-hydroxyisobutyrate dehydrogenase